METLEEEPAEEDYLEALKRLKAEYDNYRRRTESERHIKDKEAVGRFAEKLLPVLEAFEAGMEYSEDSLKPVHDLFLSALKDDGLIIVHPPNGSDFDPSQHEAIGGDGEGTTIQEVIRSGYAWGDKLLRPAQVKVG